MECSSGPWQRTLGCRHDAAKNGCDLGRGEQLDAQERGRIRQQLDLLGLRAENQKAVKRGEIPLQSAYMLVKLPRVREGQFVELARTTIVRDFVPVMARLVRQIQEAARQGKLHNYCQDFEPVPYLQPLKEVLARSTGRIHG
jgi:hypothetical protein